MAVIHTLLLRTAAQFVPEPHRAEWLREWTAELFYLPRGNTPESAIAFCFGAYRDALFLRSQAETQAGWRDILPGVSPIACLAFLSAQAIAAALVMWWIPGVRESIWDHPLQAHAIIAAGAILLSPLAPGARRLQRSKLQGWCFMAAKLSLLSVSAYFATFDIVPLISRAPMQPQLTFVLYFIAYRWAISDQNRRCPVCLRLLTNPVPIGHSAGTLLEWYGTEFVCAKGHGVLHEPEPLMASYCKRRWVSLDASWRELFP
jgi:hypothetical protein